MAPDQTSKFNVPQLILDHGATPVCVTALEGAVRIDCIFSYLHIENDSKRAELPLAATYVIDRDGKIVYSFLDADYAKRAEPDAILAALKGL